MQLSKCSTGARGAVAPARHVRLRLERGRREVPAATAEGVATPLDSAMLALIRDLEEGRREQSFANFDELVSLLG